MTRPNLKTTTLMGLSVAALASQAAAALGTEAPMPATQALPHVDQLNSASLVAIASSWLKVPNSCKARGFNAEPAEVAVVRPDAEVTAIYRFL